MFRKVMRELSILVPTDFILTHSQFMGFLREVQSLEQLFNVLKQKGKEINLREKEKKDTQKHPCNELKMTTNSSVNFHFYQLTDGGGLNEQSVIYVTCD